MSSHGQDSTPIYVRAVMSVEVFLMRARSPELGAWIIVRVAAVAGEGLSRKYSMEVIAVEFCR